MEFVNMLLVLFGISASVVLGVNVGAVDVAGLKPCNFPAIYNFGTSNSDTGSLSAVFYPIPPPYGQTFFKRPAGRASDGRLIIDFIAEHLKLPHLSAYLNALEANFEHGANFASIDATFTGWNGTFCDQSEGLCPFGLYFQVNFHFDQFKNKTIDQLYHKQGNDSTALPNPKDLSKALYTIDIGQSDLSAAFWQFSNDEVQVRANLPNMVNSFATYVRDLYKMGARNFWIHNAGPVGCLPNTTLHLSNIPKPKPGFLDQNGCVKSQNDIAGELNMQLKDKVIKLRTELPAAVLTYVDVYSAVYDLISNAKSYGFNDPMKVCCGVYEKGIRVKCGKKGNITGKEVYGASCEDPSKYISWDGLHHTEAANRWIANRVVSGSLADPPFPITYACRN